MVILVLNCGSSSIKYQVICKHKDKYSISQMCKFFGVSRSGYYGMYDNY